MSPRSRTEAPRSTVLRPRGQTLSQSERLALPPRRRRQQDALATPLRRYRRPSALGLVNGKQETSRRGRMASGEPDTGTILPTNTHATSIAGSTASSGSTRSPRAVRRPEAGKITFADFYDECRRRQVWVAGTRRSMDITDRSVTFGGVALRSLRRSRVEGWVKSMAARGLFAGKGDEPPLPIRCITLG